MGKYKHKILSCVVHSYFIICLALIDDFFYITESEFLEGVHPRMAGALILRYDPQAAISDLYWLHTTRTMGVCYMTTNDRKPQVLCPL